MDAAGILMVGIAIWLGYCSFHSYNPYTLAAAVLKNPSGAGKTLSTASTSVAATRAGDATVSDLSGVLNQGTYGQFPASSVTCSFSCHTKRNSVSPGIDFGIPAGTPLYAPYTGVLSYSPNMNAASGNTIMLHLKGGYLLSMRHVESVNQFLVGKTVPAGELIGFSGGVKGASGAGDSTGPHVHVDLRTPQGSYIPFTEYKG